MTRKQVLAGLLAAGCLFGSGFSAAASEGGTESRTASGAPSVFTDREEGIPAAVLLREDDSVWAVDAPAGAPEVKGKGAVLMDITTGTLLFEQDAHARVPIASVTKIMTLLLVAEAIDDGLLSLSDTLTCSPIAASMGGSQIWLEPGEQMTVDDLLKAAAVVSANDACAMLAEQIAGSIEGFVARMNTRADELGMKDTNFLDCSGLNDEAYSCAYDVALMSCALMRDHPEISRYTTIWMDTLRGGKSQLVNTNKLVRHYAGATGLKTGTTSAAGHNLSATATRDGVSLCAVMLGSPTTNDRFGGCRKLLDYGFANYTCVTPKTDTAALTPIPVRRGTESSVGVTADPLPPLLLKKGQEKALVQSVTLAEDLEAPVEKGQTVGELTVTLDGETLAAVPIRAEAAVPRLTFFRAFTRLLTALAA